MVRGQARTASSFEEISSELAALRDALVDLERRVRAVEAGHDALRERQLDEFDRVRDAVANATDDLVARLVALDARTAPASGDAR